MVGQLGCGRFEGTFCENDGARSVDPEEVCPVRSSDAVHPGPVFLQVLPDPPERLNACGIHAVLHRAIALVGPDAVTVGVAAVGDPLVVGARLAFRSGTEVPPRIVNQTRAVLHGSPGCIFPERGDHTTVASSRGVAFADHAPTHGAHAQSKAEWILTHDGPRRPVSLTHATGWHGASLATITRATPYLQHLQVRCTGQEHCELYPGTQFQVGPTVLVATAPCTP